MLNGRPPRDGQAAARRRGRCVPSVEPLERRWLLAGGWRAAALATGRPTPPPPGFIAPIALPAAAVATGGSITGQVFQDNNGNATLDAGELFLNGVTVFLDLDLSSSLTVGDAIAVTAGSGNYTFANLPDGSYSIGEVPPPDFVRTGSLFLPATIAAANTVTGKNHGNFRTRFNGSPGSDSWLLRIDPGNSARLQIVETLIGTPANYSVLKALLSSITIIASTGDDLLTVDQTNGPIVPDISLTFDGGTQSTLTADRILVTGSAGFADDVTFSHLDVASGGGMIAIRAIERITINGGGGDDSLTLGRSLLTEVTYNGGNDNDSLIYTGTENADILTLLAGGLSDGTFSTFVSGMEMLTVNAAGGADGVTLNASPSGAAITIQGGAGNDTLTCAAAPASAVCFDGGLNPADQDTLNINAGLYAFNQDANVTTANLTLNVGAAGAVQFNATQHLAALSIAGVASIASGGSRVLCARSLAITGAGTLDLRDNDLIVDYSAPDASPAGTWNGSSYTGISGLIAAGRIKSTSASASTLLGIADATGVLSLSADQTALWSGQTIDSTCVLVKYTYGGDCNLDGKINIDDYGIIDFNVASSGMIFAYANGDLNLDGKINIDDYGIIDFGVSAQGPPL